MSHEMAASGEMMCHSIAEWTEGTDQVTKRRLQAKNQRRIRRGDLSRNDSREFQTSSSTEGQVSIGSLLVNLAIQQEMTQVEPGTIDEMKKTTQLLSNMNFRLDVQNVKAAVHALVASARADNLRFALMSSPSAELMSDQ